MEPLTDAELERERRYAEDGYQATAYIVLRLLATIDALKVQARG